MIIGFVLMAALLVVPRPGARVDLPLPLVDRAAQRRGVARLAQLAGRAERDVLPYGVRAVGEQVRRAGIMTSRKAAGASESITELRRLVRLARKDHGDDPLLVLRALQTVMFVHAVERWLATGIVETELTELAGNFPELAEDRGWVDRGRLVISTEDLASVYVVRWTTLAGLLGVSAFAPNLDDWRVYFRLRLGHPDLRSDKVSWRELSDDVGTLSRKDSEYPEWIARGVLAYYAGRYEDAAAAYRKHLTIHPHGPWTLRAKNYLAEALDRVPPSY